MLPSIHFLFRFGWLAIIVLCFQTASAQDSLSTSPQKTNKWHYRVEPYLIFPSMVGETGISAFPLVKVDANTGDIFEKLKIGAMLSLEAANDKWAINSDFLYMNLEEFIEPTSLIKSGKINAKQLGWELAGLRRINPWLEVGAGALLNSLKVDLNFQRIMAGGETLTQNGSQSKTWVDPMLIARMTTNPAKNFVGQFRGEIGGFGIGSDLAWQLQAVAGYRISKLLDITAGYRVISLDYTSGEGNKVFVYDMVTHGPTVKFGFSF